MPSASLMSYFKTYFNITSADFFIASGDKLQAFMTAHTADILANDPEYSAQSALSFIPFSGNIKNDVTSTQKWVKPFSGLLKPNVEIALIMYRNDVSEDVILRVSNASINTGYGYPGI